MDLFDCVALLADQTIVICFCFVSLSPMIAIVSDSRKAEIKPDASAHNAGSSQQTDTIQSMHRHSVTTNEHGHQQQLQTKSYEANVRDHSKAANSSKLPADDSIAYNKPEPFNSKYLGFTNKTDTNIANKQTEAVGQRGNDAAKAAAAAVTAAAATLNLSVSKETPNVTNRTKSDNNNCTQISDLSESAIPLISVLTGTVPGASELDATASQTAPTLPTPPPTSTENNETSTE